MIDLEARARTLNEQAVTRRLPVKLVVQRGNRIRARRRVAVVAIMGSLLAAVLPARRCSRRARTISW
jgi:hypothetical protein